MQEQSTKAEVINIGAVRKEHELQRRINVGEQALRTVMKSGQIDLLGAATITNPDGFADTKIVDAVRDVALRIRNTGGLTGNSIAAFMLMPNKLIKGYRPLDMVAVEEPDVAVEAGECFVDPGREFSADLLPAITRADGILNDIYSEAIQTELNTTARTIQFPHTEE